MNRSPHHARAAPPRGRVTMAVVAVAVLVSFGALVGGNGGAVQIGGVDPAPELIEAAPRPIDVVHAFGAALADDEPAAAAALVADGWTQLELPGLPWRFFDRPAPRADLVAALGFYGDLVDVEVAGCRVQSQTLSSSSAQVVCDSYVDSPFADVGHLTGRVIPTTYWIENDRIAGILRSHLGSPMLQSYCHWAEQAGGTALFDRDCMPVIAPGYGEQQQQLAAAYLEAGRPGAGRAYRRARNGISVVDVLVQQHNAGGSPNVLAGAAATGQRAPGLLGGAPPLDDFLAWSKVVYQIDLGSCIVDGSRAPATFGVECPAAEWSGPLVAGLTLDPLRQSVTFSISNATVRSMTGPTDQALLAAWQRFCSWAVANRPQSASFVIGDGCVPVYTTDAARAVLMLLGEYAADPR